MSLYRRPDSPIWYVDIRHGGRRIRRSAETADRVEAERFHDELKARTWKIRAHGKRWSDALAAWQAARPRKSSALRDASLIRRRYGDRPLREVTEESIIAVFGAKSPGTYNKLASTFRAAMNLAHARGWIDVAPVIRKRPEPIVEPPWLTHQEWRRLKRELPPHLRIMAAFAVATGLRWSNVAMLTWDRVSIDRRTTWVPARSAKAGKTIPVPLQRSAVAALRCAPGDRTGYVFTYNGKPIKSPKGAWNKATKRAGIHGFRWHDLRHTWASWHAMGGTPLDVLQRLGGWQTQQMVQRYAHLAPSYVASYAGNARPVTDGGHTRRVSR